MQSLSIQSIVMLTSTCSIVHANEPAGRALIKVYPQLQRELLQVNECISVDWKRIQVPKVGQIDRGHAGTLRSSLDPNRGMLSGGTVNNKQHTTRALVMANRTIEQSCGARNHPLLRVARERSNGVDQQRSGTAAHVCTAQLI
jgi:hypothetical protein